ncbi:MAG TPA: ATP-binding cassette domain-containing protein [Jatrophihabitantaceae bacterium]|nr:ATP-binding cassette domain-containing protein [Jatrophihabitantaceae bacterium]
MSLRFDRVSYRYRREPLVFNEFSLKSSPGVTVLLGPNGAGKTTLMRLAAAALYPASGTVSFDGDSSTSRSARARYRRRVGWLPQQIGALPAFSTREQVAYAGWLKGLGRSVAWDSAKRALARVDLAQHLDRPVTQLSGGQLRRVGVAQVIVHDAQMILMDEPTAGLDPAQRSGFRCLIGELQETAQLLISTHQTEDLADICNRVLILNAGRVCWDGSTGDFLAQADASGSTSARAEASYKTLLDENAS